MHDARRRVPRACPERSRGILAPPLARTGIKRRSIGPLHSRHHAVKPAGTPDRSGSAACLHRRHETPKAHEHSLMMSSARMWRKVALSAVRELADGRQIPRHLADRNGSLRRTGFARTLRLGLPRMRRTSPPTGHGVRRQPHIGPSPLPLVMSTGAVDGRTAAWTVQRSGDIHQATRGYPVNVPDTHKPNLTCFSRFVAFLRVRDHHRPSVCP
jgi:hypothetical protein